MSYRRFGRARSLRSDRASALARSLRSDRAEHAFGCCVATLFELLSDDSRFFCKAFRKEESISKKYLSKKVSTFSSSGIWTLTSPQPFSTPTNTTTISIRYSKIEHLTLHADTASRVRPHHRVFVTLFRIARKIHVNRILPPTPADLFAKRDLLRGRPFFWSSFTVERIRGAAELHRSRAVSQPLDVPYDVEPVIDVLPAQRQRIRSRKGKGVASESVLGNLPLPEWNPSFSPGFMQRMRVFNAALDGSFRESHISHFKAEDAEREHFRFRRQAELHSRALVRTERRSPCPGSSTLSFEDCWDYFP
ncbi:hypothetical protein F2Q70_00012555 [Brassica cretica]|uniref:Uncharacterized protein n=1 Tax=Brassica cretica TaxID=69181 RepID=A0A8S9M7M3_BRACR|nr:hypothetical protein F2Q70_00012555 [Brassica cretica]